MRHAPHERTTWGKSSRNMPFSSPRSERVRVSERVCEKERERERCNMPNARITPEYSSWSMPLGSRERDIGAQYGTLRHIPNAPVI